MSERVKRPVAACLACVLGFVVVASLAYRDESFRLLDARVLLRLSAQREAAPGEVARLIAHLGDPVPQLILLGSILILALVLGPPRRAVAALVLVAGANLTTQLLKTALAQLRYEPSLGYAQIGSTAFPSGHATAVAAMAFAVVLVVPRGWRVPAAAVGACLAVAVDCSVVLLHRHYPSDVIGGGLIAATWFFAVVAGLRQLDEIGAGRAGRRS